MNDITSLADRDAAMPLAQLLRDAADGLQQVQPPADLRARIVADWHAQAPQRPRAPVSYTHLTLPTIYSV